MKKTSIWDILTAIVLFGILCMVAGFAFLVLNPGLAAGTAPLTTIPTISLPTATATVPGLPPTWTPVPVEVQASATLRPSATIPPTNTPVLLPTFTASPRTSGGGSGGGTSGGNCSVTFQEPADNTYQEKGKIFTMRWVLKNNSSNTWRSDSVDIRFVSGDRMSGRDQDLSMNVSPGGQVDIFIPNMIVPNAEGKVTSNWGLFEGSTSLCRFYVEFNIK